MQYVLGFSGGMDSVCLWHKFSHLNPIVVHVNHNVSEQDFLEEYFCKQFAKEHNFELIVHNVYLDKGNFEKSARVERYKALSTYGNIIMTGHHKNDNIETFFLNLFRGAALRGLSGMKEFTPYENINLYRPLLKISKKEILQYCQDNNLNYYLDSSNNLSDRNRVFIRNSLIPMIETHYPNMSNNIEQTMKVVNEQVELLNEIATSDWNNFCSDNLIDLDKMCKLSFARQKNAWFGFIQKNKIQDVKYKSVNSFLSQLNRKNIDAKVSFKIGNFEFKQNKNKLEIKK